MNMKRKLRELYASEEVEADAAGTSLFTVYDFEAQENGGLLQVSIHMSRESQPYDDGAEE